MLIECSGQSFYRFLSENSLKEIRGESFHSSYFIDDLGEKKAYMETSSWGVETIYKISETHCNQQSTEVITNIINRKI